MTRFNMLVMVMVSIGVWSGGCARQFSVYQDATINTGAQHKWDASARSGEPLELNIVCLTAKDLKKDTNVELKAGSGITSDRWFSKRPVDGDEKQNKGRFEVPRKQVLLLTDDPNAYGVRRGAKLRGSKVEGKSQINVGELPGDCEVFHVFAKFVGEDGAVLPTRAVTFTSGDGSDLWVHVGVEASRYEQGPDYGQFMRAVKKHDIAGK